MQLHLVSEPEGQFQLSCVVLFLLAMLSSVSEPDISSSLAVLGLVAVALTNHNLMQLVRITPLIALPDTFFSDQLCCSCPNL